MTDATPTRPVVMVVEDELLIAATLEIALESNGYDVLGPVATVDEGMQLLRQSTPDMAVIDYRLATTTTEALLPVLSAQQIPVCVLTGYDASHLPPAYSGHTILEKPFRLATLLEALEQLRHA